MSRARSFLDALRETGELPNPDEARRSARGHGCRRCGAAARVLERAGDFEKPAEQAPSLGDVGWHARRPRRSRRARLPNGQRLRDGVAHHRGRARGDDGHGGGSRFVGVGHART